jgi:arylsulfatase A-like enzyme
MKKTASMTRRDFLGRTAVAASAIAAAPQALPAAENAPASAATRPNILLVLSDDHSAPHVGCYGNPDIRTPNLDRLASQGMRFDRAYVACPQCVPSRAAIMTGRSPVRIAMTRFSAPLPADVKTYPEHLRAAGYFTGVAGRTYHLDGPDNARLPEETRRVFEEHGLRTFPKRLDYVKTSGNRDQMLQQYVDFLDLAPKDRPFFLQLCFGDPHRPLDRNAIADPHDPAKLKLPAHYPDTPLVREDFARYYDEISRFDDSIGRVLAVLDERGLAGNTIVAMMGDNGASQLRGKGTLYEFGIHVPLIVRWPGKVKAQSAASELISGEDLAPTFLEAAGLPAPEEMSGRSFLKLLRGEPFEGRRYVFSERGAHGQGLPNASNAFDLGRCVVTRTHKLIYNALWQIPYAPVDFNGEAFWKELRAMSEAGKLSEEMSRVYFSPTRPMFELYDLANDPREFNNLIGRPEAAAIERELKSALQEWMILQRDYLPLPIVGPPAARKPKAAKRVKKADGATPGS